MAKEKIENISIRAPMTYTSDDCMNIQINWPEPHKLRFNGTSNHFKIFRDINDRNKKYLLMELKDGKVEAIE